MTDRERFLTSVAAHLTVPNESRGEIMEELAAHLGDSVDELIDSGQTREDAEREAIARLGSADALARALAAAHRRPVHVLAAAGAGTWAAARTGVVAAIVTWLVVGLLSFLAALLARAVASWLGEELLPSTGWSAGWNSVLTAVGLGIGGFKAGEAAVRAVAQRGWWALPQARTAVGLGGGIAVAVVVLGVLEQSLNWASVVAMLLVPLAFALGARLADVPLPGRPAALALLLVVIVPVGVVSLAVATGGGAASYDWDETTHGYEMIGPWWQDPAAGPSTDFASGESWSTTTGVEQVTVFAASPEIAARFHAFRLEAWRAEPPGDGWRLLPGQTNPFATAPMAVAWTAIAGTLRYNQTPGADWAQVVVTAVGPDERRYILSTSSPRPTVFFGSVVAWFAALGR
jgi:hypothetical protein